MALRIPKLFWDLLGVPSPPTPRAVNYVPVLLPDDTWMWVTASTFTGGASLDGLFTEFDAVTGLPTGKVKKLIIYSDGTLVTEEV